MAVPDVKLPIMRNCKKNNIVIWTLFWGKKGYTALFDFSWVDHCPVTNDCLDNFYCVLFHKVFVGCISDYCSLLLPA